MRSKSVSYIAKATGLISQFIAIMSAWLNAQVNTCRVSCALTDAARRITAFTSV